MSKYCGKCGAQLNDTATQCHMCNTIINKNVMVSQTNIKTNPKTKKRGCLLAGLIASLILFLIPVILLLISLFIPDGNGSSVSDDLSSTQDVIEESFAPTVDVLYEKYTEFEENGQCGDNAFWKISSNGELLIIHGTGELKEYDIQYEGNGSTSGIGDGIKYLIVEEGITKMKHDNISFYDELEYVYLPSSLIELEPSSINHCQKLSFVSFPNGNENYIVEDSIIFSKDKSILVKYLDARIGDMYEIPECVKTIKKDAFSGMQYLNKLSVPATVTEIEGYAFSGNYDALSEIYISDGVERIGDGLFNGCYMLKKIHLPNGITKLPDYTFNGCKSLEEYEISYGVTEIGYMAFQNCEMLKEVTIPETVTVVWGLAFDGCKNLKSLTLPKNLMYIGHENGCKESNVRVFGECTSLDSIIIPKGSKIRASYVFKKWTAEQTIYFEDVEPGADWNPKWSEECSANIVWGYK